VLEHPDTHDLVVALLARELAVVAHLDQAAVLEPGGGDPLARDLGLRLAERDPVHLRAVPSGAVERERTEPAANAEQALARREAELAAEEVELALLRRVEVVPGSREVCARVHEPAVEERREELGERS